MENRAVKVQNAYSLYFSASLNDADNGFQGSDLARENLRKVTENMAPQELAQYLSIDQLHQVVETLDATPAVQQGYAKALENSAPMVDAPRSCRTPNSIRGNFVSKQAAMDEFSVNYAPMEDSRVFKLGKLFGEKLGLSWDPTRAEIEVAVGRELVHQSALSKEINTAIYAGALDC